jgi:protein phosphatase/serine/threonine-protein phosphatase Stp1
MITAPVATSALAAGRFRSWAATHVGTVRTRNEDAFVNRPDLGVWAVADGAGGHQAGEVASGMVAGGLSTVPGGLGAAQLLYEARSRIFRAHELLRAEAERRGADATLATTVVLLLARDDHYACLWAGDSRAYLLRRGRLIQITHDHSLVQELIDAGSISAEAATHHPRSNIITRAIGANGDPLDLDKVSDRLQPGDRFLLCSDGLSKIVPGQQLAYLLATAKTPAEHLVAAALQRRADDNVTAVAIEVG